MVVRGDDPLPAPVQQSLLTVADTRFGTRGSREEDPPGQLPPSWLVACTTSRRRLPTLLEAPGWTGLQVRLPARSRTRCASPRPAHRDPLPRAGRRARAPALPALRLPGASRCPGDAGRRIGAVAARRPEPAAPGLRRDVHTASGRAWCVGDRPARLRRLRSPRQASRASGWPRGTPSRCGSSIGWWHWPRPRTDSPEPPRAPAHLAQAQQAGFDASARRAAPGLGEALGRRGGEHRRRPGRRRRRRGSRCSI